jgi:D-alanine-D-alanine ligase
MLSHSPPLPHSHQHLVTPESWKIALLHNPKPGDASPGLPDDFFEEYDSEETIASIKEAIEELGAVVVPIPADCRLPQRLAEGGFQFVFNIAEGSGRRCREAIPAAICELIGLPFTGSDLLTLGLSLDKAMARRVVASEMPLPRAVLIQHDGDLRGLESLNYPVIIKPNDEGSSKGIRDNPVADTAATARQRCQWLRENYDCPVIVEEFIDGVEVTVGILGNSPCEQIIGVMEIAPVDEETRFVYSLEVKRDWRRRVRYHVPPRLDGETRAEIERLAVKAYRLLGCRDCARMDFRLDRSGKPHFLECNPLPGLNPSNSDIMLLSQHALPYKRLVQGILLEAAKRTATRMP